MDLTWTMTRAFELDILGHNGHLECAWKVDPLPQGDEPGLDRTAIFSGAVPLDYDLLLERQNMSQKREQVAQVCTIIGMLIP